MVRTFVDERGRAWQVWNVSPSRKSDLFLPATMAEGWLCFECAEEKRRLHPIPDGWEELDDAALARLALQGPVVQRRTSHPEAGDA